MDVEYPDLIESLPQADVPMPDVKAKLLQGEDRQVVFFEIPAGVEVPPHSHGAQWGVVLEGELDLTIGGVSRVYSKGDSYHIPDGVQHSARPLTAVKVIDVFAEKDRYSVRS